MLQGYRDILSRINEPPKWWDENGVPRFDVHHPNLAANIYSKEVLLLEIACQACHKLLAVQITCDLTTVGDWIQSAPDEVEKQKRLDTYNTMGHFAYQISQYPDGEYINYGDPPAHNSPRGDEYCHAGCTMTSISLRTIEYWRRAGGQWDRDSRYENIQLDSLENELYSLNDIERYYSPRS